MLEFLAVDGFDFEEFLGDRIQLLAIFLDQRPGKFIRVFHDLADFAVDLLGNGFGVITLFGDFTTEENHLLFLTVGQCAHLRTHAQSRHHSARHAGHLLDVIGCARGDVVEDQLFGGAPAQCHGKCGKNLLARHEDAVFIRAEPGHAAGLSTPDDGHFLDRVSFGDGIRHNRMTGFMVGNDTLLFVGDETGLAFRSHYHTLDGFFQFGLSDGFLVAAGG